MIPTAKFKMTAAVIGVGLIASACTVLKTPDPIQTYRFGAAPAFAGSLVSTACEPTVIALRRIEFADAARGDRILAVTGTETAYIGGARWVSQAESLFQASLEDAFNDGAPCLKLAPTSFARDGLVLAVDVRRFETVYASAGAVPQVHLSLNASLINPGDRSLVAQHKIDVVEDVEVNRVSAIVAGYDRANAEVVRQVVTWVGNEAPKALASAPR